jgi:hypothetical protein
MESFSVWDFRTTFLVEVSGQKLEPSQARVFVWFSGPHFSVVQNVIHD